MIQNVLQVACACDYRGQTPEQILISIMVSACTEQNVVKFMADKADKIATIRHFNEFENAIRQQHEKFDTSLDYQGYTGLGAKPPNKFPKINAVRSNDTLSKGLKLDKNGEPPVWMKKKPCFTCRKMGHTLHTCDCKPPTCNIDGCKLKKCKEMYQKYKSNGLK